jgi:hypothetical protein
LAGVSEVPKIYNLQQSSTMSRLPELFREENPDGFNELTDDG